jgi:mono/diheme cytochrome c family protein
VDDLRKITYGVLIGFVLLLVLWISFLTFTGCGFKTDCAGAVPTAERTSIPTLVPATLPALVRELGTATSVPLAAGTTAATSAPGAAEVAMPSNPGGPGPAINLTGDPNAGQQVFVKNCQICHGAQGQGGNPNPGSTDGTVPALNPIDPTLVSADHKAFATNLDRFIEHGSTPAGPNPTFSMIAWGDKNLLVPQQIADVIAYVISLNPKPAPGAATAAATTSAGGPAQVPTAASQEVARPSNPGGPGPAVGLTGDATSGQQIFVKNCQTCHGAQGVGGNPNLGADDGTIPALNPIDPTMKSTDYKAFATNLDLFIEHGSTPAGTSPTFSMIAWGDKKLLTPQEIADVMAYVISLNK